MIVYDVIKLNEFEHIDDLVVVTKNTITYNGVTIDNVNCDYRLQNADFRVLVREARRYTSSIFHIRDGKLALYSWLFKVPFNYQENSSFVLIIEEDFNQFLYDFETYFLNDILITYDKFIRNNSCLSIANRKQYTDFHSGIDWLGIDWSKLYKEKEVFADLYNLSLQDYDPKSNTMPTNIKDVLC